MSVVRSLEDPAIWLRIMVISPSSAIAKRIKLKLDNNSTPSCPNVLTPSTYIPTYKSINMLLGQPEIEFYSYCKYST